MFLYHRNDTIRRKLELRNRKKSIKSDIFENCEISFSHSESRSLPSNGTHSHRSKSKASHSNDPPSSPETTVFCIRSSDSSSSQHRNSHRRQNPLPRRPPTQTTPTDYVNKLANLFTKNFTSPLPLKQSSPSREQHISTQTYDTVPSSPPPRYHSIHIQPPKTTDDLPLRYKEQVRQILQLKRYSMDFFSQCRSVFMIFQSQLNVQ